MFQFQKRSTNKRAMSRKDMKLARRHVAAAKKRNMAGNKKRTLVERLLSKLLAKKKK